MQVAVTTKCPLCGCPVRVVRRPDGAADHYEALPREVLEPKAVPIRESLRRSLADGRRGKKTIAIVGSAWNTRAWAPYGEPDVEVWCINEMHAFFGVGTPTAWFQLHPRWSFTRTEKAGHWAWLQRQHTFPIYMQKEYDGIPSAKAYPLKEVLDDLVTHTWKGEEMLQTVFGSTFAYATALALHQRPQRLELFGIEMSLEGEWAYQRESMAFWLGRAEGLGVEVWMPEECQLFCMPLYAYEEVRDAGGVVLPPPEGWNEP